MTGNHFEWPTTILRSLGAGQADTTFGAVASTKQTIGGREQLVYLPLDLAQERRHGFGLYILRFAFASFPIEDIAFTVTRLSADGTPSSEALPLDSRYLKRDAGTLLGGMLLLDLSKQPAGLYRMQMQALASADKRQITSEFIIRHGSTEWEK